MFVWPSSAEGLHLTQHHLKKQRGGGRRSLRNICIHMINDNRKLLTFYPRKGRGGRATHLEWCLFCLFGTFCQLYEVNLLSYNSYTIPGDGCVLRARLTRDSRGIRSQAREQVNSGVRTPERARTGTSLCSPVAWRRKLNRRSSNIRTQPRRNGLARCQCLRWTKRGPEGTLDP